jgi:hypothetical protein
MADQPASAVLGQRVIDIVQILNDRPVIGQDKAGRHNAFKGSRIGTFGTALPCVSPFPLARRSRTATRYLSHYVNQTWMRMTRPPGASNRLVSSRTWRAPRGPSWLAVDTPFSASSAVSGHRRSRRSGTVGWPWYRSLGPTSGIGNPSAARATLTETLAILGHLDSRIGDGPGNELLRHLFVGECLKLSCQARPYDSLKTRFAARP